MIPTYEQMEDERIAGLRISKLTEVSRQEYSDCTISSGITDHPVDHIYLRFERPGEEPTTIYLRYDEATSCIWLLAGSLWSKEVRICEEAG